jgi:hypothetical protein
VCALSLFPALPRAPFYYVILGHDHTHVQTGVNALEESAFAMEGVGWRRRSVRSSRLHRLFAAFPTRRVRALFFFLHGFCSGQQAKGM